MIKLKGKDAFTKKEIEQLKALIKLRNLATPDQQKRIRDKMRKIGFYGMNDWGIYDMQLVNLNDLIRNGDIKISG